MKAAVLAFLFTLWMALREAGYPDPYHLPLSMFRDGPHWALGYTLFALLVLIGALMAAALKRAGQYGGAGVFAAGVPLLAVIALTPSDDGFHFFCSLVLLFLLYTYYGAVLHLAESRWCFVHWLMPVILLFGTGFLSYGLWQKAFIVYCVLAIALHHHLLGRPAPRPAAPRGWRPAPPLRKRVVYVVAAGPEWHRRR
jgi:hypothetical protein